MNILHGLLQGIHQTDGFQTRNKNGSGNERATIGTAPPIPLKKDSVFSSTLLSPLWRMTSQMIASTNETKVATSTLSSMALPVVI